MLVIKEKDAFYFVSPMRYNNYSPNVIIDYGFEENGDIWHLNDGNGTIVMVNADSTRLVDVIRYSNIFDHEFSKQGMFKVVDDLMELIKDTNCISVDGRLGASIYIARGTKGYRITTYGAVFEIGDMECVGESFERTVASYEYCKDIPDVHERVKSLYDRMGKDGCYRYYPIAVINTKDDSYTLLTNK